MTKKLILSFGCIPLILTLLSGCTAVGDKTATTSIIYLATSVLALVLLLCYYFFVKNREPWFLLLFSAVSVVNIGYLSLSISSTLQEALLANRISYLGSVFLPVSMLMSILKTCNIKLPKWAIGSILGLSLIVFLIAASPGYLDIYYKEVSLVTLGGASTLKKVYGPLHSIYLYYLLGYFAAMIFTIIFARRKKYIKNNAYAVFILSAVLINIFVWLMEQLVDLDFEFLSVSYIASELFLLVVSFLINELSHSSISKSSANQNPNSEITQSNEPSDENTGKTVFDQEILQKKSEFLSAHLYTLTRTENEIYKLYLNGKRTKDVMAQLGITENTLKYHNRNLYSKLGVANRKELLEVAMQANSLKA